MHAFLRSRRSVPPQSLFVGEVIIVECQSYHPLVSSSSFVVVVVVVAVFIICGDVPALKNRRVWSLANGMSSTRYTNITGSSIIVVIVIIIVVVIVILHHSSIST